MSWRDRNFRYLDSRTHDDASLFRKRQEDRLRRVQGNPSFDNVARMMAPLVRTRFKAPR